MKNKIHKYDFLIVGAGLIGAIAALALVQKKLRVLVIDKDDKINEDNRTLAVNANSKEFLKNLGLWNFLKSKPESINKIVIKDNINKIPLIFENDDESMGKVILNKEIYQAARQKLKNLKILKIDNHLEMSEIYPNKKIRIKNIDYSFKKIIISIGKSIISEKTHRSIVLNSNHQSLVGFFKHSRVHDNTAYEFFTDEGPLAILPSPSMNKKKSTFIYSTKGKVNKIYIQKLINKKIGKSHGKLFFDQSINTFPITPHLTKKNDDFIYVGDSLKSIHPVAGQGWNLGIKDIQTLCKLLDRYSIDTKNFNSIYYSRRIIESAIYLGFTSVLNFLYENKNSYNEKFIKVGFMGLEKIKFLKKIFIKQAMGRINLID
tara:strand:- start:404 stop:1525 length:1122 start_codon:yes stop_codon:yes gene_type:complete